MADACARSCDVSQGSGPFLDEAYRFAYLPCVEEYKNRPMEERERICEQRTNDACLRKCRALRP